VTDLDTPRLSQALCVPWLVTDSI